MQNLSGIILFFLQLQDAGQGGLDSRHGKPEKSELIGHLLLLWHRSLKETRTDGKKKKTDSLCFLFLFFSLAVRHDVCSHNGNEMSGLDQLACKTQPVCL